MQTEKITIDDVIARTIDALLGAGLKCQTVWGQYNRDYVQLSKYFREKGSEEYDLDTIEEYLKLKESQYHKGDISHHYYVHLCRSMKILIEYASNGILTSAVERKSTKFTLHETFESILHEYLEENTFHPNTQGDIVWAVRRFLFFSGAIRALFATLC